jgi:hypothetical protein
LEAIQGRGGGINPQARIELAKRLSATEDQIEISAENLAVQQLLSHVGQPSKNVTAFGREFLALAAGPAAIGAAVAIASRLDPVG